jgi:hypothetical protein
MCTCDEPTDGGGDADRDYATPDFGGRATRMTGVVWSPGHVIPISGALVYFAGSEPPAIPPGAYPETCVDPPTAFFVRSNPDGSFAIDVAPGHYKLVVQKGQFRRVRDIDVPDGGGPVEIAEELTTLPNDNGDGDTIPHLALLFGLEGGDHIEDVLGKLTLGEVGADNRLSRGTEHFDIYNIAPYEPNTALLQDLSRMLEYHIIFFPCTILGGVQLADPTAPLTDDGVLENIRSFMRAGGKIYATDMMYDVLEQPLPEYMDICGDDATLNAGDQEAWAHVETMMGWTSHGESVDADLSAWLDANGIGSTGLDFDGNFVWIESLLDTLEPAPGEPIPPKVWVQGDFILESGRILPLAITFPYPGGKALFSTYHTVGDATGAGGHDGIYPQEFVLVYLIMEIGVCEPPLL